MITATALAERRVVVPCPECRRERYLLPETADDIARGARPNRCRRCAHAHLRVAPVPAPPADPTWRKRAVCLGMDLAPFFARRGGAQDQAVEICRDCPVTRDCLIDELSHGIKHQYGIRGGTTPTQRRAMLRRAAKEMST